MRRCPGPVVAAVVFLCVGAGSTGTLRAQAKPADAADTALPFEPWERVFRQQDGTRPAIERLVQQLRRDDRVSRDARPPCVMPVIEVSADIDPRMVVPLPETHVRSTMPIIEGSCQPDRR